MPLESNKSSHANALPENHTSRRHDNSTDDLAMTGIHPSEPILHSDQPAVSVSPTPEELQDMERQRRQELLARKKAVLATRQEKLAIDSNFSFTQMEEPDVTMLPAASTEIVDSFLSSIGPVSQVNIPSRLRQVSLTSFRSRSLQSDTRILKHHPGISISQIKMRFLASVINDPVLLHRHLLKVWNQHHRHLQRA